MCDIEESIQAIQNAVLEQGNDPSKPKAEKAYKSETQTLIEKRAALLLLDVKDSYSLDSDTKYEFKIVFTTTKNGASIVVNHIDLFKK